MSSHAHSLKTANNEDSIIDSLFTLANPLKLLHGGEIAKAQIAYCLYGNRNLPCLLVLGGISAGRHIAHKTETFASGWWQQHIGHDLSKWAANEKSPTDNFAQAINLDEFCVLSIDYLGGNGESSAVEKELAIDTRDQATAIAALIAALNLKKLHSVIGSSYGGMVALSLLAHFPKLFARGLIISAAHKAHPASTALRHVQRQIIELAEPQKLNQAVALARSLAMLSYRTPTEFGKRFSANNSFTNSSLQSDVLNYLNDRGEKFSQQFRSEAFSQLSLSTDLHFCNPAKISAQLTCVAVIEDQLIPYETIQELSELSNGHLVAISSVTGHDAFLTESKKIAHILTHFLRENHRSSNTNRSLFYDC